MTKDGKNAFFGSVSWNEKQTYKSIIANGFSGTNCLVESW